MKEFSCIQKSQTPKDFLIIIVKEIIMAKKIKKSKKKRVKKTMHKIVHSKHKIKHSIKHKIKRAVKHHKKMHKMHVKDARHKKHGGHGRQRRAGRRLINLVPRKKKKLIRVPLGIPNFDKLIQGGFEKNTTNLLVGGSGSGKTIFAAQFLVSGMKKGEKCLYVTFEEKKEQFYENMKEFGWDLEEYEKKGLFTFLEYTPIQVKTMLEEGGGSIESIILKKKIDRMVFDSITSFALLFEDELSKREAALALFGLIRGWNCTALLTLEEEPLARDKATSSALEFESDSIIILYFVRQRGERERYVEVMKMRGTKHSEKVYAFEIGKGGIIIKRPVSKFIPG